MTTRKLVNRSELARDFGVTKGTITRWEADGMPTAKKAGRGRETLFSLKACRQWRDRQETAQENLPRRRKELAQALEVEQRVALRARDLVSAADVAQVFTAEYARARTKLRGLPRKAKAVLPHLSARDVHAIDELITEALEELTHG